MTAAARTAPRALLGALLLSLALAVLLAVLFAVAPRPAHAQGGTTVELTITSDQAAGGDPLLVDDTFTANLDRVQAALAAGGARTLILPPDVAGVGEMTLSLTLDDLVTHEPSRSIGLQIRAGLDAGPASGDVDILLLVQWAEDDSVVPLVSVGVHAGDQQTRLAPPAGQPDTRPAPTNRMDLGAWGLPLPGPAPVLPDTWLGVSTGALDLSAFTDTPADTELVPFYPEGFTFGTGVNATWRSTVALSSVIGDDLTTALGYVSGDTAEQSTFATLDGQVDADWGLLTGDVGDVSLSLSAVVPQAPEPLLDGDLIGGPWTLGLTHTVTTPASPIAISFDGAVTPDPVGPLADVIPGVTVAADLTYTPIEVSATLRGAFDDTQCDAVDAAAQREFPAGASGCWADAVGVDWLDLTDASVVLSSAATALANGGLEIALDVGVAATFDPDGPDPSGGPPNVQPLDLTVSLAVTDDVIEATVGVSRPDETPLSIAEVALLFDEQGTAGVALPGQDELSLTEVIFSARLDTAAGDEADATPTFTITATTKLFDDVTAEVLIGLTEGEMPDGTTEPFVLLGIRTTDTTLGKLFEGRAGGLAGTAAAQLPIPAADYSTAFPLRQDLTVEYPITITQDDLSDAARAFYRQDVGTLTIQGTVSIRGTLDLSPLGEDFAAAVGHPAVPPAPGDPVPPLVAAHRGSLAAQFDWGQGQGASIDLQSLSLSGALPTAGLTLPPWMSGVSAQGLELYLEWDGTQVVNGVRTTLVADLDGPDGADGPDGTATGEQIALDIASTYDTTTQELGFTSTGHVGRTFDADGQLTGPGTWAFPFGTELSIGDPTITFAFSVPTVGPVTPQTITASGTISGTLAMSDTRTLALGAELALADGTAQAAITLALDASADPLSLAEVVEFATGPLEVDLETPIPAELLALELRQASLRMTLEVSQASQTASITALATTTYDGIDADLLASLDDAGSDLVGLRLRPAGGSSFTIGDFFPADVPLGELRSFSLPDVTLALATAAVTGDQDSLDPEVYDFFAEINGCSPGGQDTDPPCEYALDIGQGASLLSSVPVPDEFAPTNEQIFGIDSSDPVVLTGFVPLFGNTVGEPTFTAVLPPMDPPGSPSWFESGRLSIVLTPTLVGFEGLMVVDIDGDLLAFAIEGELQGGATPGIELAGELASTTGLWETPFGIPWLDLRTVRIELGISGSPDPTTGSTTIGFRGAGDLGGKDLDISVLVALDGGVPTLRGIRGASADGFTMTEIATLQVRVAAALAGQSATPPVPGLDGLPELSLKGAEFSYALEADPDLCLPQGIVIGGDLFINAGQGATGQIPTPCGTAGRPAEVPPERPDASAHCIQQRANGCLVSMRVEVDQSGTVGKASLPGFDIGVPDPNGGVNPVVLDLDDLFVDLLITDTQQYVELSGGGRVPGVAGSPDFVDGFVALRLTPTGRAFAGDFRVFDTFYAYVEATIGIADGQLNPIAPGFASFDVTAQMRGDFASQIGGVIEPVLGEVDRVVGAADGILSRVDRLPGNDPFGELRRIQSDLRALGVTPPGEIQDILDVVNDINGAYNRVRSVFTNAGLPAPPRPSTGQLVNFAMNGWTPPSFPGVPMLRTPEVCITVWVDGTCYSSPPLDGYVGYSCNWYGCWPYFVPPWPGTPGTVTPSFCPGETSGGSCYVLGLAPRSFPGIPGVGGGSLQSVVDAAINPLLRPPLAAALGVPESEIPSVPGAVQNLVQVFGSTERPLFDVTCAEFSADVASLQESNTVGMGIDFVILGNDYELEFDWTFGPNPADVAFSFTDAMLRQVLNGGLVSTTPTCAGGVPGVSVPLPSDLVLTAAPIEEGETAVLAGTFSSASAPHTVSIRWDDRHPDAPDSRQTISLPAGTTTFSAPYTPGDDRPTGTPGDVRRATVTVLNDDTRGGVTNVVELQVDNTAPSAVVVDVTPRIDETGEVTLTGTFIDPGIGDSHVIEIDWGDGSDIDQLTLPVATGRDPGTPRAFGPITHVYADDLETIPPTAPGELLNVATPAGTPSDPFTVTTTVTDDDTGVGVGTGTVIVDNVEPTLLDDTGQVAVTVSRVDVAGDPLPDLPDGELEIIEGQGLRVTGAFTDIADADIHTVTIGWGGQEPPTIVTIADDQRTFDVVHRYPDDDPTGTGADPYDLTISVIDDDQGLTHQQAMALDPPADFTTRLPVTVVNDAPRDVEIIVSGVRLKENDILELRGRFSDEGVRDSFEVVIDWDDGTAPETLVLTPSTTTDPVSGAQVVDPIRSFTASHRYLDDDPTGTDTDDFTPTITLTDDDGAQVTDADMALTYEGPPVDDAGEPILRTDPDGTVTFDPVEIPLADLSMQIIDLAPEVSFSVAPQIDENEVVTLDGTAIDPGVLDTFTLLVDWGDGTDPEQVELPADPSRDPLAPFPLPALTHRYLDDDPTGTPSDSDTVTVRLTDDDGLTGTTTQDVTLDNVDPTVDAGVDQRVFEDDLVSLDPVRFTDPGTVDTFTSTIDWGDGTPLQTVAVDVDPTPPGDPGGTAGGVAADHRFADPGRYTVWVCIADDDQTVLSPRPAGTCDELDVVVLPGYLRFATYGRDTLLLGTARVDGAAASGGDVRLATAGTVSQDLVSVAGDVDLSREAVAGGSVVAGAEVSLNRDARVDGDVDAGTEVDLDRGATVGGAIREGVTASLFADIGWGAVDTAPGSRHVRVRGTQALASGDHGRVEVGSGSTLQLSSGVYRLSSLRAEDDAVIELDLEPDDDGVVLPIVIEVDDGVTLRDRVQMRISSAGSAADVLILVAEDPISLGRDGAFLGTFVAAGDRASLGGGAALQGALIAASTSIASGAAVVHEPGYDLWVSHLLPASRD